MAFHNFALDLAGRRVLVVGGGQVGTRRALTFAAAGAIVRVISPAVTPALAADPRIETVLRPVELDDLGWADLVHTATGVAEVDAAVVAEATRRRLWCVDATRGDRATAHVLTHREWDQLTLAVHSHGDPRRSRATADALIDHLRETGFRCPEPTRG